jgi:hypothetical protein
MQQFQENTLTRILQFANDSNAELLEISAPQRRFGLTTTLVRAARALGDRASLVVWNAAALHNAEGLHVVQYPEIDVRLLREIVLLDAPYPSRVLGLLLAVECRVVRAQVGHRGAEDKVN